MTSRRVSGLRITNKPSLLALFLLLIPPCSLTQKTDEVYIVEPTPALRLGDEDLTTVLLVNNDNRTEPHGRFLNVRPTVGLLTSTARTFIQEGVTTEYATQVLGTTLENGRLYAQLLKKSSRVLYKNENTISPSTTIGGVVHTSIVGEAPHYYLVAQPKLVLQSHNDLIADKDWQDVDDKLILEKNSFVGNTDYIGSIPRVSQIVFPINVDTEKDTFKKPQQEIISIKKNVSTNRAVVAGDIFRIKADKVQPGVDLPTFTVKNMFSPSGFSWETSNWKGESDKNVNTAPQVSVSEQRSPKLLYHQVMKEDARPLSTVTYYGFADFTTIVGDSVIVFSPSTSSDKVPLGHVTSIKGEATLGRQDSSYVSNVAITITQDVIEPTYVVPMLSTDVADLQVLPKDMRLKNEEELTENQFNGVEEVSKPPVEEQIEITTTSPEPPQIEVTHDDQVKTIPESIESPETEIKQETTTEMIEENTTMLPIEDEDIIPATETPAVEENVLMEIPLQEDIVLISSMSDVGSATKSATPETPQAETTSLVMLSRPSDEEILRIYSSLVSAEAAKKFTEVTVTNQASTNTETTTTETTTTEATTGITSEINESTADTLTTRNDNEDDILTTTPTAPIIEEQIQPDIKIEGGATTVFFEDDPFLEFVSPSSTETIINQQTSSVISKQIINLSSITKETEEANTNLHEAQIEDVTIIPVTEISVNNQIEITTVSEVNNINEANTKEEKSTTTMEEKSQEHESKDENSSQTEAYFKPIIKEVEEHEQLEGCIKTSQVFLTQVPKTLTYYTTFFIANENDEHKTSTSVKTNIVPSFDISQATKHYCIQSTPLVNVLQNTEVVIERPSKPEQINVIDSNIEEQFTSENLPEVTTPMMVVRENAGVTEGDGFDASGAGYEDEEDEDDESDENNQESVEEIELIYKTLYTTYTYLTTFFHDSTTSVSSRKEIVTNVITSSLGPDGKSSIDSQLIEPTVSHANEIAPTVDLDASPKYVVESSDLVKINGILREDSDSVRPTTQLDDSKIAKTYYTTYTYYTTIFVDGETEVMSRTEVHTNVVGRPTDIGINHSGRSLSIDETVVDEDNAVIDIRPTATYETIQQTSLPSTEINKQTNEIDNQLQYKLIKKGVQELESSSSSSSSSEKKLIAIGDDSNKMIADVHSSNSNRDHLILENGVLEDQISSESNTDEIIPSATLLLQTSYTTFTYYTTMYSSDAANVVSRLETVTNVVTETLQPTKTLKLNDATLPITYFTTFTYWTKLSKDGEITTLSREETISNVVTPTLSDAIESNIQPTSNSVLNTINSSNSPTRDISLNVENITKLSSEIQPTTFYTTFTYYTTSYAGDQTITDSRFETVTNVVMPSIVSSPPSSDQQQNNVKGLDTIESTLDISKVIHPPRTIFYDYKTIVDAEEISTLYFRTEIVATEVDGTSTEISSSTSTINIDEIKKALSLTATTDGSESTRAYKTGLVRLIDGTKLFNRTTTVYQSKVIGTIIEQRYAQIIESTSSFIIEKTSAPVLNSVFDISATATLSPTSVEPTSFINLASSKPIESSISDAGEETNQNHEDEEGEDESEEEDDENGRPKTRLSFQTKKKTFTPVIRPFASRNRPQFAPKRKNIFPSSATIITRSDFTPTITATPAIKSESRGRFSSSRKSNSGFSSSLSSSGSSLGGKRFGRPSKSSQFGGVGSSSSFPGSSRNRFQSSRIQASSGNFGSFQSSRRSGVPFRGSSSNIRSSAYAGNSRLKIRPSNSLSLENSASTIGYTTLPPDSEEEGVTQRYDNEEETDLTTENLRKSNNPLLRFRRPQINRPSFQPGQRNSPGNQISPRRNPLTPKPKTTTSTTTTTQRPKPRAFQRPIIGQLQNRPRPQSNLFPPRRLFGAQNINQAAEDDQKTSEDFPDNENDENDSAEYENDGEGIDEDEQEAVNRRRRESFSKLLAKKRSKRQADSSVRNKFRNRFRRPSPASKPAVEERIEDPPQEEPSTVRSRSSSRFTPRSHSLPTSTHSSSKPQHNSRAIRPTKPSSNNRAQFTLRERDTTPKIASRPSSNFRRPLPNGVTPRRTTTAATRPKAPRLKTFGTTVTESSHSSPRGKTPASRPRSTVRGRSRNDFVDPVVPIFDGTITITHTSPAEITIPVVNGKVTEYKNIVTTTTSTEVLQPNQYTSIIGPNGASTLVLNREDSSVNLNGATEVTQFILHESPTTSVTFTPTTIRGRKTSFAHIIPSTAYQVENIVSTMQAQIAANAPLANILLSQLLLGNIGLNQPNINPLLALGATPAVPQTPGVPTTDFVTRTSTYITTITHGMATIIPLTFHGKEILTTIYDSSSDVITATEYFTETIVVTPTQQAQQVQQVNSLLLPLLLQQQLQGQSQAQPALPLQNSIAPQLSLSDNLQDLDSNGIQKFNDYSQDIEDYPNTQDEIVVASQSTHSTRKSSGGRKKGRKFNKQSRESAHAPSVESSVITLYVSGRRPGEFSTVLSTVQVGGDASLHKRQISRVHPVLKSDSADYEDFYRSDGSEIQEYLLPANTDFTSSHSLNNNYLSEETQSLESIVGDVGLWYAKTSAQLENLTRSKATIYDAQQSTSKRTRLESSIDEEPDINTNRHQLQQQNTHNLKAIFDSQHETPSINFLPNSKPEPTDSGRFFHFGSFDIGPPIINDRQYSDYDVESIIDATGIADEARYNLATRVMSNGVEVIIAGDKNGKGAHKSNALRILPSLSHKPITLAPSTLKDQMILVMPSNVQENYTIPINSNHFITKTCLTTYTYRTTYLQGGKTTVESREKVVSNTATEERNYLKISPTESLGFTLTRTPELAVGVFHTTYTYYNTILDGDLPLVVSSQHILTNTITGPDDYILFLQPSEEATPVLETNTYFSKISLTKTLKDSDIEKIVSTSNILTQVIITESLPPRSTAVMTSYIAFDIDETSTQDQTIKRLDTLNTDVTNSKRNESSFGNTQSTTQNTRIHSEMLYLYNKKDQITASEFSTLDKSTQSTTTLTTSNQISKFHGSHQTDMHIYATKTYLTTFTYFTTLMSTQDNVASSTIVNFHTRVIENVITESIPSFMIETDLLSKFENNLKNPKNHNSYVTVVTLAGGQSLEITAMNMLKTTPTFAKLNTRDVNATVKGTAKIEPSITVGSVESIASITAPSVENPIDSDVASSENDEIISEQYITPESEIAYPKNNTKTAITTDFPSVNQIIGSLNLNRLQALGPVFNAMAGLIQNNFGTSQSHDLKKNISALDIESKHSAKNISALDNTQGHEGPIYIPVQNLHDETKFGNTDEVKIAGYISPQSLHISPPETEWFFSEKRNRGKHELVPGKPTYETPLLNGGIPISPGEVITANSDVIVGKPNGIQPRVPFNSKLTDAASTLLPPPPVTPFLYKFQHQQQNSKQTKANLSPIPLDSGYDKKLNFDGILKPPPLKPPVLQKQQQNIKKLMPPHVFNPNYRPYYPTNHMHQQQKPYSVQQVSQHISKQNIHQQNFQQEQHYPPHVNAQRPGSYNLVYPMNNNPQPISQKPIYIPYAPYDYDQPHSSAQQHKNEILEIKRIPEVYSTDLPGIATETKTGPTPSTNNIDSANSNYKTLIKKVIGSDKTMLVDIQPSQITNIVIPRDNAASILIVESAVELHKNGQYYDEPTTYTDAKITGNVVPALPVRKPISSNQQVNLDMNVLSHNVDINVPPITFNKDTDFPHSTPVRGQIHSDGLKSFNMPRITIPITDNQIQVSLTPQNTITQTFSDQFFNDLDSRNITQSITGDTFPSSELASFTKANKSTSQQKPQLYFHTSTDMKHRPMYNEQLFNHFGNLHRPIAVSNENHVPQFVGLSNKVKLTPQIIPLEKTTHVISTHRVKEAHKSRPIGYKEPQQVEYLHVFKNVTPSKRPINNDPSYKKPFVDPVPLFNLFYGSQNDGEDDLSGDFSQAPASKLGDKYWQLDSIQQDDDDETIEPTEDLQKGDDQRTSSSLNIGIPSQNKSIRHESIPFVEIDSNKSEVVSKSQNKPNTSASASTKISNLSTKQQESTNLKVTNNLHSLSTFDKKPFILGVESFLDPASVKAVNNMSEITTQPGQQSSDLPLYIPNISSPPVLGKPFTKTKPNIRPPLRINNQNNEKIFISSGESFKFRQDKEGNQTNLIQLSIPVNVKEDHTWQKDSNTQTEAPFNSKYTKAPKWPKPTSMSTTLLPPILSSSTKSNSNLNLNEVEIVNHLNKNQTNYTQIKESAEIFDYHESINPQNFDFVNIVTNESTTIKENLYASDFKTIKPDRTNLYTLISEPSINMKPPPISMLPKTENVMGLSPPPPPTKPVSSHTTFKQSPAQKTSSAPIRNRNPSIPALYTTPHSQKIPPTPSKAPARSKYTPGTLRPRIKPTASTKIPSNSTTISTKKYPPTTQPTSISLLNPSQEIPIGQLDLNIPSGNASMSHLKPTRMNIPIALTENTTEPDISMNSEISSNPSADNQDSSSARKNIRKPSKGAQKNINGDSYEMFLLNQTIPDEILIEGSEANYNLQSSIKIVENQTDATTIIRERPVTGGGYQPQQSLAHHPSLNRIYIRARNKTRIIIPTKYVTNTQILTVTTTKTSVLTSLGIQSTQTFTLTKTTTSTLIDTVTKTHTLLQPSRVVETQPTTTTAIQISHTDYQSNANMQPTVEIISDVLMDNLSGEQSQPPLNYDNLKNSTLLSNVTKNLDNNSIFVVMTDKKNPGGVFSISPSMIDTPHNINAIGSTGDDTENMNSVELDYDENNTFDLPTRDEEVETNEVNHVLLGGVLIATPPKPSEKNNFELAATSCRPSCKASRNEICQQVESRMLCACRPGFARMFPDRPCRPTYTYAMQIPIYRISKQVLHFKEQYRIRDSDDFKQLAGITHDAVDRMVMQSDLRDVYHGVHVTSFDTTNAENGILGQFLIQLSDNSDEKRLVDVFKKYLRQNNFSLGGTEIFTTKNGVNSLEIADFDECAHNQFHDCSENSRCFNLQGTYTCSCQEGYVDLSENSIYPGRLCSAEMIGCERCHYHGKCLQIEKHISPICECFHWYTGASCQLNLKIFLIALIAVGTILFILLLFCMLVTCNRRRKNNNMQSLMSGIHIIAPRNSRLSTKNLTIDKRAMIKDSSSEASQNSLPYVLKTESKKQNATRNKNHSNQHTIQQKSQQFQQANFRNNNKRGQPSSTLVSSLSEMDLKHNYSEQSDRSLTVMIPRAKYHHSINTQAASHVDILDHKNEPQLKVNSMESELKSSAFHSIVDKSLTTASGKTIPMNNSNHSALHTSSTGALVSAGFEVSATVGNIVCQPLKISSSTANISSSYENRNGQESQVIGETHSRKTNYTDLPLQYNTYKEGEKYIDSMDVWLDTIQQNELTAEARSFDETTIQAPTKSLRSVYERQTSQSNGNDEANTMAERDIGSTFLLPHTHLYKPDRDSDVSGFDSF